MQMLAVELECAVQLYFCMLTTFILLAPSVQALQSLVNICVTELNFLDMAINTTKSSCLRYGSRTMTMTLMSQ